MLRSWSHSIVFAGAFLAGFFAYLNSASAQTWEQIGNFPGANFRCSYFWDTAHGVVAGDNHIYYYNSGIWKESTYPETPAIFRSLRLLDGKNLYAASGSTCVWESTDSGATWQLTTSTLLNADDIYLNPAGTIQGMSITGAGMMLGSSFARINPMICAAARDDKPHTIFSNDGGVSWNSATDNLLSGYCMVEDTCSGTFYTITDGLKAELYSSTDGGKTWGYLHDFADNANDVLAGANSGVLYVQGPKNVWRYESGIGFDNLGGPGTYADDQHSMFAFGENSRYLVDTKLGAVWLWVGPRYLGPLPSISISASRAGCSLSSLTVQIYYLESVRDSVHIHAYDSDGIILIPSDTTLALTGYLTSVTLGAIAPRGEESGTIYFHDSIWPGFDCQNPRGEDQAVAFALVPERPRVAMDSAVTTQSCQALRLPLTIVADICDTVRVDSIQILGAKGLYSYERQLPDTLLPGSRDTFWLYLDRTQPGAYITSVRVVGKSYSSLNQRYDTTLYLFTNIPTGKTLPTIQLAKIPKITSCSSVRFPLSIQPSECDTISVDSVVFQDTSSVYWLDHHPPDLILPNGRDTFGINISQPIPGTYTTTVRLYAHSLWTGAVIDTFMQIKYTALPDAAWPRTISSKALTLSGCRESAVPIILQALPCDSVKFATCTLTIDNSLKYSTNLTFSRTLSAGEIDTLLITFPQQNLSGTYIISAHITGRYSGSTRTFDTAFEIRVTFTSSAGALAANNASITLDTMSTCALADTLITFKNLGCDTITVMGDGTIWQPSWSADDPSFPFQLAPDSSFTVRVHFHPSAPIWSEQLVSYSFKDIGGKAGTSLPFTMNITVVPAVASLSLSDTSLDFGTFARCTASGDTTIMLTNSGCDSLSLNGAIIVPGTGFTLITGGDTVLGPNESVRYRIAFTNSIAGNPTSTLTLHAIGAHGGRTFDTTITLSATVVPGSHIAVLSRQAIDFGTTSICEERDSTITISNTGCEADTITLANFLSDQFVLSDTLRFPLIVPPHTSVTIPILTQLDSIGHPVEITDTLRFMGDLDLPLPPVVLSRGVEYPGRFSLGLNAEDSAAIGATVAVYVLRKGTIPSSAEEVDFDLIYNNDLLSFVNPVQPDIQPGNASLLPNGLTNRSFALKPATDRDTIATLEFQSYLAKQEHTPITLSSEEFISGGAISPPCVASMDSGAGAGFPLELACGDGNLVNSMMGLPLDLASMNVLSDALTFTLDRGDATLASCSAEILTILGSRALSKTFDLGPVTSASFDLHSLSAGAYFLRISAGRSVIMRRFVIVK